MNTDLVPQEQMSVTLFGTDNPAEVVSRAAVVATALADLVRKQNLIVRIGQSDHVRVEGWTLLGSMLGVFPVVTWTRPVKAVSDGMDAELQIGWEARVEARTRGGEVVGAAEAECLRTERTWKGRDDYALRSMAQTRAVSKALRLPLGFVMQLAGFNPTPAEEMVGHPTVDMYDPDIPFGDAPDPKLQPPKYISEAQRTRLWTLAQKAGVGEPALRAIVQAQTGQESTKKIKVGREYDAIVAALGSSGGPNDPVSGHDEQQPGQATGEAPSMVVPPAGSGVEPASPDDEITALTLELINGSKDPAEAAKEVERHRLTEHAEDHLAWLLAWKAARGGGAA
jgi:hypothetical protein